MFDGVSKIFNKSRKADIEYSDEIPTIFTDTYGVAQNFINYQGTVNLTHILTNDHIKLVNGGGGLFHHPNEKALKIINNWVKKYKFHGKGNKATWVMIAQGKLLYFLMPTESGDIDFHWCPWSLVAQTAKKNEHLILLDVWVQSDMSDMGNMQHVIVTKDFIKVESYYSELAAGGLMDHVPSDIEEIKTFFYKNDLQYDPFGIIIPSPYQQPYLQTYIGDAYPIITPIGRLQYNLEHVLRTTLKEERGNRTRIFGILTPDAMQDIKAGYGDLSGMTDDFFIQSTMATYGKDQAGLTVLQGDPKFQAYTHLIDFYLRLVYKGVGRNYEPQSSQYDNATKLLMGNRDDLLYKMYYQSLIKNDLDKIFKLVLMHYGISEEEAEELTWEYVNLDIVEQLSNTDENIKLFNHGIITHEELVARVRRIHEQEANALENKLIDSQQKGLALGNMGQEEQNKDKDLAKNKISSNKDKLKDKKKALGKENE